jgi:hypothetical protein
MFGVIRYYFTQYILLELIVYIVKLIWLIFLYSLDSTTILCHLSYQREDDTLKIQHFCVSQMCHNKEGEQ